jgi:hypothetical protein
MGHNRPSQILHHTANLITQYKECSQMEHMASQLLEYLGSVMNEHIANIKYAFYSTTPRLDNKPMSNIRGPSDRHRSRWKYPHSDPGS